MTSLPPAKSFNWTNLGLRTASAAVLIPAVVTAVFIDLHWPYLVLVSVSVAMLAIEWGGMSAPRAPVRLAAAVTAAVLICVFLAYQHRFAWAWLAMAAAAAASALVARGIAERTAHPAYGVVYIAPGPVCLSGRRSTTPGRGWTPKR